MKHEWKKTEKKIYAPKAAPEIVEVPHFNFFTIQGEGNPNNQAFSECINILYSISYGVKMSYKHGYAPDNYFDFAVYPLEGIWDLKEEAKLNSMEQLDKEALIFKLMIRQPEFVTPEFSTKVIEKVKMKKPHELFDNVHFERIGDGKCIQMLHVGSFDNEPESFAKMEAFAQDNNLKRISKLHREIYLSDARKTPEEKLKTILRFQVK